MLVIFVFPFFGTKTKQWFLWGLEKSKFWGKKFFFQNCQFFFCFLSWLLEFGDMMRVRKIVYRLWRIEKRKNKAILISEWCVDFGPKMKFFDFFQLQISVQVFLFTTETSYMPQTKKIHITPKIYSSIQRAVTYFVTSCFITKKSVFSSLLECFYSGQHINLFTRFIAFFWKF